MFADLQQRLVNLLTTPSSRQRRRQADRQGRRRHRQGLAAESLEPRTVLAAMATGFDPATNPAAGDANLDGQVDIFDIVSVTAAGAYGSGAAAGWSAGDFNGDAVADVFDMVGVSSAGFYGRGRYVADPMPHDPDPADPHAGHPGGDHSMPPMDTVYTDLASFGMSEGSDHTHLHELEGGRTPITTEALVALNGLRDFLGLSPVDLETVGRWAFANELTNNAQAWGNDLSGVGLYYSMQGAKVGWIRDVAFDPQILADIQRTARLGGAADALAMVETFGHEGFRDYLATAGLETVFVNTLKMEPHYAGWMHDRCHGWLDIDGVAIAHDLNHLTVLSHDQTRPFMNDTFDWPQWPALEVSHDRVIDYFQSMVTLGDPLGGNISGPPGSEPAPVDPVSPPVDPPPTAELPPAPTPAPIPEAGSPVLADLSGDIWWGGLTVNLALTNTSGELLENWTYSFVTPHEITESVWGLEVVAAEDLGDGLTRYTIRGADYGAVIQPAATLTVGFTALQGIDLGTAGALTAADVLVTV
jgi:hypothetical protein